MTIAGIGLMFDYVRIINFLLLFIIIILHQLQYGRLSIQRLLRFSHWTCVSFTTDSEDEVRSPTLSGLSTDRCCRFFTQVSAHEIHLGSWEWQKLV